MNTILQIGTGLLIGDFLVAAFHWFEDTYLPYTEEKGLLGQMARDNEMHHFLPYTITTFTPLENISVTFPLALGTIGLLYLAFPKWAQHHWPFLLSVGAVGTLSNLLHRYMHERPCKRPQIISTLQDLGLLVSTPQHADHHDQPHRNYGVVFGFTNAVYDSVGIWRLLETIVPLQKYPKTGVDAYKAWYDAWTKENMGRSCPGEVTMERLEEYKQTLRRMYSS